MPSQQVHRFSIRILFFYSLSTVSSWEIPSFDVKIPKFNSYNPWCFMNECCNEDWIKFKRARLKSNLTNQVFGQPLLETAVDALASHFNPHYPPTKALTMSFHGMTGTGKNYVSNFIADSMFREGSKSKYVHHFIGRMHFSEETYVNQYRSNLYNWLKGNITNCPKRLFIFDEVDKMIPDVLNIIKPMIDYREDVEGVNYSQAVFIFLSNTGADIINEHYHDIYIKEGKSRENLQMSDFEIYIQRGAFNEQGGFHHSDTIKNNLIDHYIPFLPLEEKHVIKCIEKEFKLRNVHKPKPEHIDEVMKFIEWGPDSTKLFSKTGCKRLGPKVGILVDKHYRHVAYMDRDEL